MIHQVTIKLIRDGLGRRYWQAQCACAAWEISSPDTYQTVLDRARAHERAAR